MPTKIRGIHVSNRTCWQTEDLWGFLRPLVIAELERPKWRGLEVVIQPRRSQWRSQWRSPGRPCCYSSGFANWSFNAITINVPTKFDELNAREKTDIAVVIAHELWHINARRGGKAVEIALRKSVKYGRPKTEEGRAKQAEHYAWAAALPLRKKTAAVEAAEPVPAVALAATTGGPRTLILDRAAKAAAALARWEAELIRREKAVKRAKRKVSAARRKAAYYAKKTGVS